MKFQTIALSLIVVLGAYLLPACSGDKPQISNDLQKSFAEMMAVSDLNQSLQVRLLSGDVNEPRFGRTMKIVVENVSDQPVYFLVNPGPIRLFIIQGGKWVQIRNDVTFMSYQQGGDGFVLSSKAEHTNVMTPPLVPALGPIGNVGKERLILRILAIGEFMANGQRTGVRVGAYTDAFISQP